MILAEKKIILGEKMSVIIEDQNRKPITKQESFAIQVENSTLEGLIRSWLKTPHPSTAEKYANVFNALIKHGIVQIEDDEGLPVLGLEFRRLPLELILDSIKQIKNRAETTLQGYASAFISFTGWMCRATGGHFRKALPNKGSNPTFFATRDKVKARSLSKEEPDVLMQTMNERDRIIAMLLLQGAKRVSEVLGLKVQDFDEAEHTVMFRHLKQRGKLVQVEIFLGPYLSNMLARYMNLSK